LASDQEGTQISGLSVFFLSFLIAEMRSSVRLAGSNPSAPIFLRYIWWCCTDHDYTYPTSSSPALSTSTVVTNSADRHAQRLFPAPLELPQQQEPQVVCASRLCIQSCIQKHLQEHSAVLPCLPQAQHPKMDMSTSHPLQERTSAWRG